MPVKPPPIPPDYEEVTELCRQLTEKNHSKRRRRNAMIGVFFAGLILLVGGLVAGFNSWWGTGALLGIGAVVMLLGLIGVIISYMVFGVSKTVRRLALANDPRAVAPLLDALTAAVQLSDQSNDVLRGLRRTLAALVPQLSVEGARQLSPKHWDMIYGYLRTQTTSRTFASNDEFALAISLLHLIRRCQDTRPLATVRSLAKGRGGREEIQRMRAAANDCLAVLEEQKHREEQAQVLLRPSQPQGAADSLLRPAGYGESPDAEELLRADPSQHS